jgi:hypothetical protein
MMNKSRKSPKLGVKETNNKKGIVYLVKFWRDKYFWIDRSKTEFASSDDLQGTERKGLRNLQGTEQNCESDDSLGNDIEVGYMTTVNPSGSIGIHQKRKVSLCDHICSFITQVNTHNNIMLPLDSDSVEIKMDNCCSRTLSGRKNDFVKGSLTKVHNLSVEGYSTLEENEEVAHEGTIKWTVLDDKGNKCDLLIPKSLYVPTNTNRLLSPQHLAQVMNKEETVPNGTKCTTYATKMVLEWNNLKHKVTVPTDC